jgi:hypothetical protein
MMKPSFTSVIALMVVSMVSVSHARREDTDRPHQKILVKLPIPDHEIECDLGLWKGNFTITKISYDKDDNELVFILKAVRDFSFTDDGFRSIKFFDQDDVDMVNKQNLSFDPEPKGLKRGESTRARLTLPDEEILKKTKRCAAVPTGFFQK